MASVALLAEREREGILYGPGIICVKIKSITFICVKTVLQTLNAFPKKSLFSKNYPH